MQHKETILKELNEIAPMLAQIDKKLSVSIDQSYFEAFQTSTLQKIRLMEQKAEIESFAPVLSSIIKPKVVSAYDFNAMQRAVLSKTKQAESAEDSTSNWINQWLEKLAAWFNPQWSVALAMVSTAVMLMSVFLYTHSASFYNQQLQSQLNQIPVSDVKNYISYNIDDIDEKMLMETKNVNVNFESQSLSADDISFYLEDEDKLDLF